MELGSLLRALIPSWGTVAIYLIYFAYVGIASLILPAKVVPGTIMQDGTRFYYRCNGLLTLVSLIGLLGLGSKMDLLSPTLISDRGLQMLSTSFIFSVVVASVLYIVGCRFLFLRARTMGWILINLSNLAKSVQIGMGLSMILYQLFCLIHVMDFLYHEDKLTFYWDIMVERLGLMLVGGYLVWTAFITTIQGWWLLHNKVELSTSAAIATCIIYLIGVLGYRGSNNQKHQFKMNPETRICGKPPRIIGGKLLASGYWGFARHYNYLADFLLSLSFSLDCGMSSPIPYIYPICLIIFFVSREKRDEAHCAEKYKEIWAEYCKVVRWRIVPYLY